VVPEGVVFDLARAPDEELAAQGSRGGGGGAGGGRGVAVPRGRGDAAAGGGGGLGCRGGGTAAAGAETAAAPALPDRGTAALASTRLPLMECGPCCFFLFFKVDEAGRGLVSSFSPPLILSP
jgi:hypothetical protein